MTIIIEETALETDGGGTVGIVKLLNSAYDLSGRQIPVVRFDMAGEEICDRPDRILGE